MHMFRPCTEMRQPVTYRYVGQNNLTVAMKRGSLEDNLQGVQVVLQE